MRFFRRKPFYILAAVIICSVILAVISHFGNGLPSKIAGVIITPAERAFSRVISPVAKFRDNVMQADALRSENEELREKVNELTMQNRDAGEYIRENERLRELLHLRDTMTGKEVLAARIISADADNFSYTVTINRGSADGIEQEDAVVSTTGVVGRISELGAHWARVTTLLSPGHSIGVRVSRTGDVAVLDGDVKLSKDRLCRLGYISGEAELIEGDIIETSGMGGIYPPGLVVGKVREARTDNSGAMEYATVEPDTDFMRLYEVLVITDWSREDFSPEYVSGSGYTEETLPQEEFIEDALG